MDNKFLITQIQEFMDKADKKEHEKTSFWATDTEKPLFDLYHNWIGTESTNPIEAEKLMMFNAGKMMEESLVQILNKMGKLEEVEEGQHRIEMERYGVPISGYMDGLLKGNIPLEIKSFYGDYQTRELKEGKPKTSYLKQLAIYMDAQDATVGKLIYIHRGTGEIFEFTLLRGDGNNYKCMNVQFNLDDVYTRWKNLYNNNILTKQEPMPDKKYKYPVDTIDWSKVSKSDISKARNNRKVIGDWEVLYSSYKQLYIEREKTCLGYTEEELEKIKEATKGYSTWK